MLFEIQIGQCENSLTVFQVDYLKIHCSLFIICKKSRNLIILSRGTTTTKDTWTEIWGDGESAAVKDDATIVNMQWIKFLIMRDNKLKIEEFDKKMVYYIVLAGSPRASSSTSESEILKVK